MAQNPRAVIAGALLSALGFNTVENTSLLQDLNRIQPTGGTAMRDSLLTGVGLILKLNGALEQLGMEENWHFVHILITDGQDTSSKASLEDTMRGMMQVGLTIPTERCRNVIIGIDLGADPNAAVQLAIIGRAGLENCEVYADVSSVDISSLFDRIQVSLGISRGYAVGLLSDGQGRAAMVVSPRNQVAMRVSRTSFAVVFNLDISGSMAGTRWQRVKESVRQFLSKTPGDDLVAGICFNESVMMVGDVKSAPPQRPALPPSRPSPQQPRIREPLQDKKKSCCSLL